MPACEDMQWAPALQLSCCPICWREEEIGSDHNGVYNMALEEFVLSCLGGLVLHARRPYFSQSWPFVTASAPRAP